jgi:hypothetical protein
MARLNALVRREIKETYWKRKTGSLIQFTLAIVLVPTAFYPILLGLNRPGMPFSARSFLLGVFPTFVVVALGVPFLIEHFYKDKMKRNIELLLALGFSPFKVWLAKVTALAVFAGACYEIAVILSLVGFNTTTRFDVSTSLTYWDLLNLLLFSPVLGMSLLGIKGLLHFLFKDIRLLNVLFILPFVLLFVFFRYATGVFRIVTLGGSVVSILLATGSACFFLVSYSMLKLLPKERWL